MNETRFYAYGLVIAVTLLLILTRRRWMNFSCVGAYTISFIMMSYIGLVLVAIGFEYQTRSANYVADHTPLRSIMIASLGFLAFHVGVRMSDLCWGRPKVHPNLCILPVTGNSDTGVRENLLLILTYSYLLIFLLLWYQEIVQLIRVLVGGSARDLLQYRLETTQFKPTLAVWLPYNFLPYVAFCGILVFLKKRTLATLFFVPAFIVAVWGKFALVHKEPLMILLIQCFIAWILLRAPHKRLAQLRPAKFSVMSAVWVLGIVFLVLSYLFMFTHDLRDVGGLPEQLSFASTMAWERLFARMPNGYLYIADTIPSVFPHYGFNNSLLWTKLFGGDYFDLNRVAYLTANPDREFGSIASDSLSNFYGGFGFAGLIVLSLLQGLLLAGIDRWISRQAATLGWLTLLIFLMVFSFYLTETTLFRALLGFGGVSFLVHALFLNKRHRPQTRARVDTETEVFAPDSAAEFAGSGSPPRVPELEPLSPVQLEFTLPETKERLPELGLVPLSAPRTGALTQPDDSQESSYESASMDRSPQIPRRDRRFRLQFFTASVLVAAGFLFYLYTHNSSIDVLEHYQNASKQASSTSPKFVEGNIAHQAPLQHDASDTLDADAEISTLGALTERTIADPQELPRAEADVLTGMQVSIEPPVNGLTSQPATEQQSARYTLVDTITDIRPLKEDTPESAILEQVRQLFQLNFDTAGLEQETRKWITVPKAEPSTPLVEVPDSQAVQPGDQTTHNDIEHNRTRLASEEVPAVQEPNVVRDETNTPSR